MERRAVAWPEWAITTRIDSRPYWSQVWQAVQCHRSQLPGYEGLVLLPEVTHAPLWGQGSDYRVFSFVNGGRQPAHDLFAGVRHSAREDLIMT
ncbi:MAG: hypothetical protein K8J31_14245 [Anaerolineae bacterium]|nr:hypothetical protein [Anaerolineae bacterium]